MTPELLFAPERASTFATGVDHLFLFILGVAGVFALLIFSLVLYFAVRYRRRSDNDRAEQIPNSTALEITWTVVPLGLALIMFFWGADLFVLRAFPPSDSADIYVVGKQWMWKLQHAEGPREIDELHVPVGRPFRLVMTSEDVIHSFFVPAFRLKQDVLPGRYTTLWFEATKAGQYHLFCTQYCGTNHAGMIGWVYALEPIEYQRWLTRATTTESMANTGATLFTHLGCETCHQAADGPRGPTLQGLYGRSIPLADGSTTIADAAYLEESIVAPATKLRRGFPAIMPTFKGQVSPDDLFQLIEYLKTLPPVQAGQTVP